MKAFDVKDEAGKPAITIAETAIVAALVLIADELHQANVQNRGTGVFRDCLLAVLKTKKES